MMRSPLMTMTDRAQDLQGSTNSSSSMWFTDIRKITSSIIKYIKNIYAGEKC